MEFGESEARPGYRGHRKLLADREQQLGGISLDLHRGVLDDLAHRSERTGRPRAITRCA